MQTPNSTEDRWRLAFPRCRSPCAAGTSPMISSTPGRDRPSGDQEQQYQRADTRHQEGQQPRRDPEQTDNGQPPARRRHAGDGGNDRQHAVHERKGAAEQDQRQQRQGQGKSEHAENDRRDAPQQQQPPVSPGALRHRRARSSSGLSIKFYHGHGHSSRMIGRRPSSIFRNHPNATHYPRNNRAVQGVTPPVPSLPAQPCPSAGGTVRS